MGITRILIVILLLGAVSSARSAQPEPWVPILDISTGFVSGDSSLYEQVADVGDTLDVWADTVELLAPFGARSIGRTRALSITGLAAAGTGGLWDDFACDCGGVLNDFADGELIVRDQDGTVLLRGTVPTFTTAWRGGCFCEVQCFGTVSLTGGSLFLELSPTGTPIQASLGLNTDTFVTPEDAAMGVLAYLDGSLSVQPGTPVRTVTWGAVKQVK